MVWRDWQAHAKKPIKTLVYGNNICCSNSAFIVEMSDLLYFRKRLFLEWKVIYAVLRLVHLLGWVESRWTDCGANALCLLQSNPSHQDLNTKVAWAQGYTGRGVVVTILDDGIEKDHPDLISNYASHFLFLCKLFVMHSCHSGLETKIWLKFFLPDNFFF